LLKWLDPIPVHPGFVMYMVAMGQDFLRSLLFYTIGIVLPVLLTHIAFIYHLGRSKGKGKAIPLQAWAGPEGSRRLRLPDFKIVGT
jgi:hypothetical protein